MPEFVIFSDLDGTLLDHRNYSFEPASKALGLISSKSIPLILCSSKTRKEIELYRTLLENKFPFISENGGAIFIPENYFSKKYDYNRHIGEYNVIEIGTPREKLTSALKQISDKTGIKIKTFSDISALEIAELTDLDFTQAQGRADVVRISTPCAVQSPSRRSRLKQAEASMSRTDRKSIITVWGLSAAESIRRWTCWRMAKAVPKNSEPVSSRMRTFSPSDFRIAWFGSARSTMERRSARVVSDRRNGKRA